MSKQFGIDLSSWQSPDAINYDQLAKALDFAILRVGFTGYGTGATYHSDSAFERHYAALHQRAVPIGVYWYSCANTAAKGKAEAEACLERIKGKELSFPVWFDTEDSHHQRPSSKSDLTDAAIAFCQTIEKAGYYVGIYASTSWLTTELDLERLIAYDLWVAQWSKTPPPLRHGIWQYSSDGVLDGYRGRLDLNYAFLDYPKLIRESGLNQLGTKPVALSHPPVEKASTLTVKPGDTLWSIAAQYLGSGARYPEIKALNGLSTDLIRAGQVLRIPEPAVKSEERIYRVKRGDSLWSIAEMWLGEGSRYSEIKALNGLSSDTIHPGQELKLPKEI